MVSESASQRVSDSFPFFPYSPNLDWCTYSINSRYRTAVLKREQGKAYCTSYTFSTISPFPSSAAKNSRPQTAAICKKIRHLFWGTRIAAYLFLSRKPGGRSLAYCSGVACLGRLLECRGGWRLSTISKSDVHSLCRKKDEPSSIFGIYMYRWSRVYS